MASEFEEVQMSEDCDTPVDAAGICAHGQLAHGIYVIERPNETPFDRPHMERRPEPGRIEAVAWVAVALLVFVLAMWWVFT